MPLVENAKSARVRLARALEAQAGVSEALALAPFRTTLTSKFESLQGVAATQALLGSGHVAVSAPPEIGAVRKSIEALSTQFRSVATVATLKQGRRWSGFVEAVDKLIASANRAQLTAWQKHFSETLFAGRAPDDIKSRLAQTPANTQALARYVDLHTKLMGFRNRLPASATDLEQVTTLSRQLEKIEFQEDVPTAVAAFFAAAASGLGASLELLTPEVTTWLRENNLIDRYVVRGRPA